MSEDEAQHGDGEMCIPIGDDAHARVSPDAPPELLNALGRLADAARQEFARPAAPSEPPAEAKQDDDPSQPASWRAHAAVLLSPEQVRRRDPVDAVAQHLADAYAAGLAARPSADTETLRDAEFMRRYVQEARKTAWRDGYEAGGRAALDGEG